MCRARSFFSISKEAQLDSGAIQDTRILTGSAWDGPCISSKIAAASAIDRDNTSRIFPSRLSALEVTLATFADRPQQRKIPKSGLPVLEKSWQEQSVYEPSGAFTAITRTEPTTLVLEYTPDLGSA